MKARSTLWVVTLLSVANSSYAVAESRTDQSSFLKPHPIAGDKKSPYPHDGDPSRFGDLVMDYEGGLLKGLPEANAGTFEGGATGHTEDASKNNVLQAADQRDDGRYNVPTNSAPSPLYGAQAFTQQMLRFEEFGPKKLKFNKKQPRNWRPLPSPVNAQSAPEGSMLDNFLSQPIWPIPTKFANTEDKNPWEKSHRKLYRP